MDSYAFEPPESALAFDDRQLNKPGHTPWLEMLVHEDRSPYTTQASKLLQQIDLIQDHHCQLFTGKRRNIISLA